MKTRNRSTGVPEARGPGGRRRVRVEPLARRAGGARRRVSLRPALGHALGLRRPPEPGRERHASEGDRGRERAVRAAGLRRLHGRPHAHDGRRGEATRPDEAVPRHRRKAEGEDGPFPAGRARRLPRPRRGVPGALRGAALLVRPQGRPLRRPRQRVRSGRGRSERRSSPGSRPISRSGRRTRRS